jgi:menaquinone-dependent protoporphyrinogen oxidase
VGDTYHAIGVSTVAKILLVYGTAYGQTERIARRIGSGLERLGHSASLLKGDQLPTDLSLEQYGALVIAGSIIRGKYQQYIRDFIRRYTSELNRSLSAFVAVSGTAASSPREAREHAAAFLTPTGWHPTLVEVFGGAVAYTQYGYLLRWIMKIISRRKGGPTDTSQDYEMTDWEAVDRFAEQLAETLSNKPRPRQGAQSAVSGSR